MEKKRMIHKVTSFFCTVLSVSIATILYMQEMPIYIKASLFVLVVLLATMSFAAGVTFND